MEKTGLKNSLLRKLNLANDAQISLNKSSEMTLKEARYKGIDDLLKKVGESKNIEDVINCERMMLRFETEFYAKDNPTAKSSLEVATKQLDDASVSYAKVLKLSEYQEASTIFPAKSKLNGLPLDSFRTFITSNRARLSNRIRTTELSKAERSLLIVRLDNLEIANKEYIKLQAIALEIKLPEKSKEHER